MDVFVLFVLFVGTFRTSPFWVPSTALQARVKLDDKKRPWMQLGLQSPSKRTDFSVLDMTVAETVKEAIGLGDSSGTPSRP